jgi:signal transduction histidine kinase
MARRIARALALVAIGVVLAACGREPRHGDVVSLGSPYVQVQADWAPASAQGPPPAAAQWRPVTLPRSGRLDPDNMGGATNELTDGGVFWYRVTIPPEPSHIGWAAYIFRASMNVEAWFNDVRIGSGGRFTEPMSRNWNRPFLWAIPDGAWRATGPNHLYLRIGAYPSYSLVPPPLVGPQSAFEADYQRTYFWHVTTAQVAFAVTFVTALLGLALWLVDRTFRAYLLFTAVSLCWSLYALNLFVQDIPVPARAWWWLVHVAVDVFFVGMFVFIHRLFDVRHPRVERVLWGMVAVAAAAYALGDLHMFSTLNPVGHALLCLPMLYTTGWLVLRCMRQPGTEALLFAAVMLLLLVVIVHDQLFNAIALPGMWQTASYSTQLIAPLMFIVILAHLTLRLARAMREVRAANLHLEARVQLAATRIEENYRREVGLQREQAAARERERIYRDLHDDLGARLLSLVYHAQDTAQATLAREALAELRTVVAASQVPGAALSEIAPDWAVEAELLAEAAGCAVDIVLAGDAYIDARLRYHLDRIVRELVANALEHGAARHIAIDARVHAGTLTLKVSDDGRGFDVARAGHTGNGLRGVRLRAEECGGSVQWASSADDGTRCTLRVPLPADDLPASRDG